VLFNLSGALKIIVCPFVLFLLVFVFLSFFYLRLLITTLGSSAFSCNFSIIVPFVYYSFNIKCVCLDDDSLGSNHRVARWLACGGLGMLFLWGVCLSD